MTSNAIKIPLTALEGVGKKIRELDLKGDTFAFRWRVPQQLNDNTWEDRTVAVKHAFDIGWYIELESKNDK